MKGKLTISRPQYSDGRKLISIQVRDEDSVTRFLTLDIGYAEFAEAITGLSEMDCELSVRNLERVGKTRVSKDITFPCKKDNGYSGYPSKAEAIEQAKAYTPEGWECDNYFGSQTSFFENDGVTYARTSIKRWE